MWQVQVKDVLLQFGLHKGSEGRSSNSIPEELSSNCSLVESKSDSRKGSNKKVFKQKNGYWECKKFRHMENIADSLKSSGSNVDIVFVVIGDGNFL